LRTGIKISLLLAVGIVLLAVVYRFLQFAPPQGKPFVQPPNTDVMAAVSISLAAGASYEEQDRYGEMLAVYAAKGYTDYAGPDVRTDGQSFSRAEGKVNKQTIQGVPAVAADGNNGWVEWEIVVPEDAFYQIEVDYLPLPGKQASIERQLTIDGELPFREASLFVFPRSWNSAPSGRTDNQGNEVRAPQEERFVWKTTALQHPFGLYRSAYKFPLQAGSHTLRLLDTREPMAVGGIVLKAPQNLPSYAQVAGEYEKNGYAPGANRLIKLQMEYPEDKTDLALRAAWMDEPLTEPYAVGTVKYNVFDGDRWNRGGMSATWTFDAPEDGLYTLAFRYATPVYNQASYRTIRIDGEIPFREMEEYAFPYIRGWQTDMLRDERGEPYLFYLTQGRHSLTMTSKVGPLRQTVRRLEDVVLEMGELSRQFVQVTAASKDAAGMLSSDRFRDYEMVAHIPQLKERLTAIRDMIEREREAAVAANGGLRPSYVSAFMNAVHLLDRLIADPESIPLRMNEFNNAQNSLANAISGIQEQPLHLDYMTLEGPDVQVPRAVSRYGQNLYAAFRKFQLSFRGTSGQVGDVYAGGMAAGPVLNVWVARGREWVELMKEMIEEDFTPRTGIRVNVNTVPAGADHLLLLSYTAGLAPDLMFGVGAQTPVEFALRNAVYDLRSFPDADEVFQRFVPTATIPYTYSGRTYAIPETQDFLMLFYRADLLQSMQMQPPQTWEDVYAIIPRLQENGMEFYYPDGVNGYAPFLMQNGGKYYAEKDWRSGLNSPEAFAAFKTWIELFVNYSIPLKADFYQRFRTGEMPVGIGNYDLYSRLAYAAPELNGRWEMAPLPGIREADGSIDRSSGGVGQAAMILRSTRHPEAAWELLKWWSSEEVQARYGLELEGNLGAGSRWNTANVEAMKSQAWSKREIDAMMEQWSWFEEQPVIPGGYYTQRHLLNAWNKAVLIGTSPRIALEDAVKDINKELVRKREELISRMTPAAYSLAGSGDD